MSGKVSVITGALGGMGMEVAMELARKGGTVVLVVRDAARGEAAAEAIRSATGNAKIEVQVADFASLASVRKAASELCARHPKIHLLSHNAAVYSAARKTTSDGFELMFGVNHLAPLLFTLQLVPSLEAANGARVVFNTGSWKNKIAFDDLNAEAQWKALEVFGRSKSANNLMAAELAERLAPKNIHVNAVDPGFVKSTLVREAPLPLRIVFSIIGQSRHEGAKWPLFVATAPELDGVTGKFFVKAKEQPYPEPARDVDARKRLFRDSEQLVGVA